MNRMLMTALVRVQITLIAHGTHLARTLGRTGMARPGQASVEWAFITGGIVVALAAVLMVLTGALNEYFNALADWLRNHKPV